MGGVPPLPSPCDPIMWFGLVVTPKVQIKAPHCACTIEHKAATIIKNCFPSDINSRKTQVDQCFKMKPMNPASLSGAWKCLVWVNGKSSFFTTNQLLDKHRAHKPGIPPKLTPACTCVNAVS